MPDVTPTNAELLTPYFLFASVALGFVAAWLKRLEERKYKEQEDRFNMLLKNIPESWFTEKRAGFTTVGTLLLLAGMSLPMLTLAVALHWAVGVNYALGSVWISSAIGIVCAIAGDRLSKKKVK